MPRGVFKRRKRKKNSNPAVEKLKETIKTLQTAVNILQQIGKTNP